MKGRRPAAAVLAAALAALGGCYDFNNPVDPEARSYRSPAESPPAAPKNLRRTDANGSNTVTIAWDAVDGADAYLVEHYRNTPPWAFLVSTAATSTNHPYPSVGSHHYRVFAWNEHGASPPSNELVVILPQ